MSILYVHGVAIREGDQPQWDALKRMTHGALWDEVRAALRAHVAASVQPADPRGVDIDWVYWGDLGASFASGGRFRTDQVPAWPTPAHPATLHAAPLADHLEQSLRPELPADRWPDLIDACWAVTQDAGARAVIANAAPADGWPVAQAAVRARLGGGGPHLPDRLRLQRRRDVGRTMRGLRRPLEGFLPYFVGDVLEYFTARGTPQQPGPIMSRVLEAFKRSWHRSQARGEPLVILTHSMGGQLVYDALTAFVPADPELAGLRAAVWCSAASQVGLCKELGLFVDDQQKGGPQKSCVPLDRSPHLGYFWNVWSDSDLLSFHAEGIVPGAYDTAFLFSGRIQSAHMAYLQHPDFYRTLAAHVRRQVAQDALDGNGRG